MTKKWLASALAGTLFLLSPGLGCWQAVAGEFVEKVDLGSEMKVGGPENAQILRADIPSDAAQLNAREEGDRLDANFPSPDAAVVQDSDFKLNADASEIAKPVSGSINFKGLVLAAHGKAIGLVNNLSKQFSAKAGAALDQYREGLRLLFDGGASSGLQPAYAFVGSDARRAAFAERRPFEDGWMLSKADDNAPQSRRILDGATAGELIETLRNIPTAFARDEVIERVVEEAGEKLSGLDMAILLGLASESKTPSLAKIWLEINEDYNGNELLAVLNATHSNGFQKDEVIAETLTLICKNKKIKSLDVAAVLKQIDWPGTFDKSKHAPSSAYYHPSVPDVAFKMLSPEDLNAVVKAWDGRSYNDYLNESVTKEIITKRWIDAHSKRRGLFGFLGRIFAA